MALDALVDLALLVHLAAGLELRPEPVALGLYLDLVHHVDVLELLVLVEVVLDDHGAVGEPCPSWP